MYCIVSQCCDYSTFLLLLLFALSPLVVLSADAASLRAPAPRFSPDENASPSSLHVPLQSAMHSARRIAPPRRTPPAAPAPRSADGCSAAQIAMHSPPHILPSHLYNTLVCIACVVVILAPPESPAACRCHGTMSSAARARLGSPRRCDKHHARRVDNVLRLSSALLRVEAQLAQAPRRQLADRRRGRDLLRDRCAPLPCAQSRTRRASPVRAISDACGHSVRLAVERGADHRPARRRVRRRRAARRAARDT
jgi:hypothetical protein